MRSFAALSLALLTACADGEGPAASGEATKPSIPAPQRLLDRVDGDEVQTLWEYERLRGEEAALSEGIEPTWASSFEAGIPDSAQCWTSTASFAGEGTDGQPLAPPSPSQDGAFEGESFLRFAPARGCLAWVGAARPDTPYEFSAAVRHSFTVDLPVEASVAEIHVYEFHELPDPSAHGGDAFAALRAALPLHSARHRLSRPPPGPEGQDPAWTRRRFQFRSSIYTNAIAVILFAGDPPWTESAAPELAAAAQQGWVDFDAVRLVELPLLSYLAVQDRSVQDELLHLAGGESPWGLREVFVRPVKISGDLRRALVAPPGTRIEIPVSLPEGPWRLDLDYGVMEEGRAQWGRRPVHVHAQLLVEGMQLPGSLERPMAPALRPRERGWHWHRFLGSGAARGTLVLEVRAEAGIQDVIAFSEPVVASRSAPARPPSNVLLISLDTLRSDHLGCYGHQREDGLEVSPRLDAFAARALRFEGFRTVAPYTLPSHATMMTGLLPRVHGVQHAGRRLDSRVHPLLAEQFRDAGYETAAFTGGGFVGYEYGFHQGFDRYSIVDPLLSEEDPLRERFPWPQQRALNDEAYQRAGPDAVRRWIERRGPTPWFLFLHTFLVHDYHPPQDLLESFVGEDPEGWLDQRHRLHELDLECARQGIEPPAELLRVLRDLYDASIADADRKVGALLDHLEAEGLLENTIVAITSDHGEEFGEHRGLLHGRTVYEELLQVPLILWVPGQDPGVLREPAQLDSLAPTLLAAAGLPVPPGLDGHDLRSPTATSRTELLAEVDATNLSRRSAWIRGSHKRIENPEPSGEEPGYEGRRPPSSEAYELASDPAERHPLPVPPEWTRDHRALLERLEQRRAVLVPDPSLLEARLGPAAAAMLRSMGYIIEPDRSP